jgi:hypothetical protein
MPSRNVLRNFNLSTSTAGGGGGGTFGGIVSSNLWYWGDMSSYDSGSQQWLDKSGNEHHADVSGSALSRSGSLGFVFNGTNNVLTWPSPYESFTTASCVDGGYTVQMTFLPDSASVLSGAYNTTALWDSRAGYVGGTGLQGIYLNDGLDAPPDATQTQGFDFSSNGLRNFYVYGIEKFTQPLTTAWAFIPTAVTLQAPYLFNYYIPSFQRTPFTNGNSVGFEETKAPFASFGKRIFNSTGTSIGGSNLTYFNYKGIVRDILIYKRALSESEIYQNYVALNNWNTLNNL